MKQDDIIRNAIVNAISNTKTYFQERVEDVLKSAIDEQIERINDGEDTDAGRDELLNDVSRKIAKMVLFRLAIEALPDVKPKDDVRDIGLEPPPVKIDNDNHWGGHQSLGTGGFQQGLQDAVISCLEGVQISAEKVDGVKRRTIKGARKPVYEFTATGDYDTGILIYLLKSKSSFALLKEYISQRVDENIAVSVMTNSGRCLLVNTDDNKDEFIFEKTILIIHH